MKRAFTTLGLCLMLVGALASSALAQSVVTGPTGANPGGPKLSQFPSTALTGSGQELFWMQKNGQDTQVSSSQLQSLATGLSGQPGGLAPLDASGNIPRAYFGNELGQAPSQRLPNGQDDYSKFYTGNDVAGSGLGDYWSNAWSTNGASQLYQLLSAGSATTGTGQALWGPVAATVSYPCDVMGGCYTAYGVRVLVGGYAGPAFDLFRASDSTTRTIQFVSGIADFGTADNFCLGTTCTFTRVYNQTVNAGHDLVQLASGTAANNPTYSAYPIAGMRGIMFDNLFRLKVAPNNPAALQDVNFSQSSQNFGIMAAGVFLSGSNGSNFQSTNSSLFAFDANTWKIFQVANNLVFNDNSAFPASPVGSMSSGPNIIGMSGAATAANTFYFNDDHFFTPASAPVSHTLGTGGIGMIVGTCNPASTAACATSSVNGGAAFNLWGLMTFSSTLTKTNVQAGKQSLYQYFPVFPQLRQALVTIGDSLTDGNGAANNQTWPQQAQAMIVKPMKLYVQGYSGYRCDMLAQNVTNGTANGSVLSSWTYSLQNSGPNNIITVWCGTNDMYGSGFSAGTTFGNLQTLIAAIRAVDATDPILVATTIDRGAGTALAFAQTQVLAYNTQIRNSISAAHGGTGATTSLFLGDANLYLVDLGGISYLAPSATSINANSTTGCPGGVSCFTSDKIHLTQTAYTAISAAFQRAINSYGLVK